MARRSEPDEHLVGVYRDATERMRVKRDGAIQRTQAAMKPTPGWQAAAKAAAAQAVLEATIGECEAMVTKLVDAHLDSGERDAERATTAVCQWLKDQTAPGLEFFRAAGPEAPALAPVALRHQVEFEAFRDRLTAEIAERFRVGFAERGPQTPPRGEAQTTIEQRVRGSRPVFVLLAVTTLLSLAGVSWLDVIRRALSLL